MITAKINDIFRKEVLEIASANATFAGFLVGREGENVEAKNTCGHHNEWSDSIEQHELHLVSEFTE